MSIEVDGEIIEIVDAHVHMGVRPRREKFDAEKKSAAANARGPSSDFAGRDAQDHEDPEFDSTHKKLVGAEPEPLRDAGKSSERASP